MSSEEKIIKLMKELMEENQEIIDCLKHALKMYEDTRDAYELEWFIRDIIEDYDEK